MAIAAMFLVLPRAGANKNFVPDWTFQGSSLGAARTHRQCRVGARKTARSSARPKTAEGGWLILDKPLQDVQFASTFRCTGGCRAGVMLRTQSTPEGIQGIYVALPEGENPAAAFALKLDPQGREIGRQPLNRRIWHGPLHRAAARRRTRRARRAGPAAGQRRRTGAAEDAASDRAACLRTRPTPVPPTPTGRTSGTRSRSSSTPTTFASGSTMDRRAEAPTARPTRTSRSTAPWRCMSEARAKSASNKSSSKIWAGAFCPTKRYPAASAMQRISDFYYAWSAAAADINHDGILDVVAGPFYYLGPDYQVSREIYPSKTATVGHAIHAGRGQLRLRLHGRWLAGRSGLSGQSDGPVRQPEG